MYSELKWLTYFFVQSAVFFENLNFCFMKTANIPVYGNIAMYGNIALFVYKTDYTLRYLEYICSVSSQ